MNRTLIDYLLEQAEEDSEYKELFYKLWDEFFG
jgi:hypothetical protein